MFRLTLCQGSLFTFIAIENFTLYKVYSSRLSLCVFIRTIRIQSTYEKIHPPRNNYLKVPLLCDNASGFLALKGKSIVVFFSVHYPVDRSKVSKTTKSLSTIQSLCFEKIIISFFQHLIETNTCTIFNP